MGLPVVLLFWLVIGLVVASVAAVVLAATTAMLTRRVVTGRRRVIVASAVFPFLCLCWGGCVFVFQAFVNELLLNRDLGIGDTWHAPLPNGYQIMMIDVTDQGWVYNPKTQGSGGGVTDREDAIPGIRQLEVTGRYILGGTDTKAFEHLGEETNQVDSYFVLDTQTGKRTDFKSYDELQNRARQLNIPLNLEPINTVYSRFRFTWFDVFAGLLSLIPPLLGLTLLVLWLRHLRKTQLPIAAISLA